MPARKKVRNVPVTVDIRTEDLRAELWRREHETEEVTDYCDPYFFAQTNFIKSKCRAKVCFCTRRAGKSEGFAVYLVSEAKNHPGSTCLYLAKTRRSAKAILWRILIKWLDKTGTQYELNRTDLTATLCNGSVICLAGVDATMEERSKFLGLPQLRLVCIDECQAHRVDLYPLVVSTIMPGLIDVGGTVCLGGTPGTFATGLYYRLTEDKREPTDPIFEVHKWTAYENPYMAQQWAAEIEDIRTRTPARLETPEFIQDYLGRWSVDDNKRVYKFKDSRNAFLELPKDVQKWTCVLSIDLGYEDDTAFVVTLFSEQATANYIIHAFKQKHMDITDVVTKIRKLSARFNPDIFVVDGSQKQAVQEMVRRHGIPLIATDKVGKSDYIELMNADFIQGTIKVLVAECEPLVNEWGTLIWADAAPGMVVRKEHPGCSNHLADAAYYGWRYTHSYLGVKPVPEVVYGSKEWLAQEQQVVLAHLEKKRDAAQQQREIDDWGVQMPAGPDWSGTGILS